MQVSLQSKICLGTCVVVSAYAAYSNPMRWITLYALGTLVGVIKDFNTFNAAIKGHQPDKVDDWDAVKDQEIRENAVKSFTNSMPGIGWTVIHLLALGLISQRVQLPSGWHPLIEVVICSEPGFATGLIGAAFFYLDKLKKDQNPQIQNLLMQAII